jgi:1-acyl-sn-glycerol-3-phosphate acyltransferase
MTVQTRTRRTVFYRVVMLVIRIWSLLLWPARVEGHEHVPDHGGALIVANHGSLLDIPAVAQAAGPRHTAFVARRSLTRSRFMDRLLEGTEAILVEPGTSDRAALRQIVDELKAGNLVVIFPEGTRCLDGRLQAFKGGAVLSARMAGVPIIPCGVEGAYDAWPRHRRWPRRRRIHVRFRGPVDPVGPDLHSRLETTVAELARIERAGDQVSGGQSLSSPAGDSASSATTAVHPEVRELLED